MKKLTVLAVSIAVALSPVQAQAQSTNRHPPSCNWSQYTEHYSTLCKTNKADGNKWHNVKSPFNRPQDTCWQLDGSWAALVWCIKPNGGYLWAHLLNGA